MIELDIHIKKQIDLSFEDNLWFSNCGPWTSSINPLPENKMVGPTSDLQVILMHPKV